MSVHAVFNSFVQPFKNCEHIIIPNVIHVCRWRYIDFPIVGGERHGRDRIVVGFITTYAINAYHVVNSNPSIQQLCDKVCQ